MAKVRHFTYPSADGKTQIHAVEWKPEGRIVGILQIAHGMLEFIERYEPFAEYMCEHGILTVGNDHLGHGRSVQSERYRGYFSKTDGNHALLADMRMLHDLYREQYPDQPIFLLGHSMGSFLARQYLCSWGTTLDGAILAGTAYYSRGEMRTAVILCRIIALFRGWMYRSRLITRIATGSYNSKFTPQRTPYDWLTRDEAVVDAFAGDPRTQFVFTVNGYYNMFLGMKRMITRKNMAQMPRKLPVLFISGEMDPVGNFTEGVKQVVLSFKDAGMQDVSCILYPFDRHEVLNELDKTDVWQDIWMWMQKIISRPADYDHEI